MKIALISANTFTEPYPVYPLGLDYVAGALGQAHETVIIDMNCTESNEALSARLRDIAPDLVGLSLRNIDNTDAADSLGFIDHYRNIILAIRTATPAPVVLGGSGFTLFPKELMESLGADYGIIGEGERVSLIAEKAHQENPGVIFRGGTADYPPPWTGPIRRRFDPLYPHVEFYLNRGGMLNLQTKRGCPYRCVYCTYPRIEGSDLRLFPPEEVAETALTLQAAGARYLFIADAVFNCVPEHCMKVAEAFIRKGLTIPWGAYFTPMRPPGGFYKLLKRAGLSHIEFGTESLCDRMLENYGKPFRRDDVMAAHGEAMKESINAAHFMLMGGPGETAATVSETLDHAAGLPSAVLFFFCGIRIYPGTGLYQMALAEGQVRADENLLSPVFYQSRDITNEEIMAQVKKHAGGRASWVFGSGGERMMKILRRMYRRGATGPLWEHLAAPRFD